MDKGKCFVIMPISDTSIEHNERYWDVYFENIKEIFEELGYECVRSEMGPYKLFSNIVEKLEGSDLVVAVLTDSNPNVWYELGIRHTLKVGTIMLLQENQKASFDISDFGIIFYKDDIGLVRSLKKKIVEYIEKLEKHTCDSPVITARNGRAVNNGLEEKVEDLRALVYKLVEELPKDKTIKVPIREKMNRILWVDDYPSNNDMVINFFEPLGIRFDIAISTQQGIQLYQENEYDLIITDMGRGNESDAGLTLMKRLNDLECKVPIILYASQRAISRYGKDAFDLGAYKVTNGVGNIIAIILNMLKM